MQREIIENWSRLLSTPEFKFLLSLLVGFLIGLEREIRGKLGQDVFAGIRTFPLIAVLGTLSAWISDKHYPNFLPLSYLGLIALSAVNYWLGVQRRTGITTEVAVFITFTLGVLIYYGYYYEVVFFAVITTFLLATKRVLEGFASHLDAEDVVLILQFLTLSVLVYPLLPDRGFYGVNPKSVWKFVILVSSISFVGYFLLKVYLSKGEPKGLIKSLFITAVLGGSVSSTAVTLSYSRLSRAVGELSNVLFLGIVVAWIVMAVRVLVIVSIIDVRLLLPLSEVFLPFIAIMLLIGFLFYRREGYLPKDIPNLKGGLKLRNPFSWTEILEFASVYVAVIILGKYLNTHFGEKGLIVLSLTSGVIDVDPITIALANMHSQGSVNLYIAVIGILLATVSNNFFKAVYAYLFGSEKLRKEMAILVFGNILYALIAFLLLRWI